MQFSCPQKRKKNAQYEISTKCFAYARGETAQGIPYKELG